MSHDTHPPSADTPLLEIDAASVMRHGKHIIDRLCLRVMAGQHTAILGPNGAGKSTLVKLITRQIYPLASPEGRGRVRVFGRERWNVAALRGLLGIVSPDMQREYTTDTPPDVFDTVLSGFFAARGVAPGHRVEPHMRAQAHAALTRAGAGHLIGRDMGSLSSGEARRVLIARALVHRPRALLLDEPCTGLDIASRRRFLEGLRGLARQGTTLLLVTHHIEEILPEVEQVLLLRDGRLFAHGSKSTVLTDTTLSAVFDMPIQVQQQADWYHAHVGAAARAPLAG